MIARKARPEEADEVCLKDPVRPDIPLGWRVRPDLSEVYILDSIHRTHRLPDAVLCLAKCEQIPITEDELLSMNSGDFIICYSVWSYRKGAGRQIILDVINQLKTTTKDQYRYITMSPKTWMAYNFHLRNGAKLLQENETTYNFEYEL
jgi:hypothetical protein